MSELRWSLHRGLPRQAPGSDATTRAMLDVLSPEPDARAVDLGCGPGRSTLVLAAAGLDVIAVDTHQPFLEELSASARRAGIGARVHPTNASMDTVPVPAGSVDVVWSEGSAYLMGLDRALSTWPPLLKPGGGLAITECCWLTDDPSPTPAEFWAATYPDMRTVSQTLTVIEECGLRTVCHWTLPDRDWWDEYYGELRRRTDGLDREERADPGVQALVRELDLRAAYPDEYGYVAFVLRPQPPP